MTSRYHEVYDSWRRDPEAFWAEVASEIDWSKSLGQGLRRKPRRLRSLVSRS